MTDMEDIRAGSALCKLVSDAIAYVVVYTSVYPCNDEWQILNDGKISERIPTKMNEPIELRIPRGHYYIYVVRFAADGGVVCWTTHRRQSRHVDVFRIEACDLGEVSLG